MNSRRVQLIVLGVAVVALIGMVLRSTRQGSLASDEAARLVRGAELDEDSPIEDTTAAQRDRPAARTTQSPSRLDGVLDTADEPSSESTDQDMLPHKTKKGRSKRSPRRKAAANSDRDDTPPAQPKGPKVQVSGNRVKDGGP